MHQIDFHNKELDALLKVCDTGDKGGRNSILDKFPDIPVMRQIL